MDKRWVTCFVALAMLTGCQRSTQLTVRAVSSGEGEEVVGLAKLVIRMLPYDRDSIFDALTARAPRPEPQPPADLLQLRDSIAAVQARWRAAEAGWNDAYSSLRDLRSRMDRMNKSSNEYFAAYAEFGNLEKKERRLNREKEALFKRFTDLQSAYSERADSFKVVLTAWEDEAFEDYGAIVDSMLEARGQELSDTTDGGGWAHFAVPKGQWWIYTRSKLTFEELYWNLPFKAEGGVDTVTLDRSNAETRLIF